MSRISKIKKSRTKKFDNKYSKTSRTKNTSRTKKIFYYLFKSDYIPDDLVNKIFSILYGNQWKPYDYLNNTIPDFTHLDGHFNQDKSLSTKYSNLRNVVDDNKYTIANKSNLYNNIKKYLPLKNNLVQQIDVNIQKIHSKQDNINKYYKYFNNNTSIWIFKPVGGFSGKFIKVFNNFNTFSKYIQQMIHLHHNKFNKLKNTNNLSKDFSQWVLQEYIDNTLLIDNRKFHMRAYFLYYIKNTVKHGYMSTIYEIALAREPYIKGNYYDSRIHDTHFYDGQQPRYFPRDFPFSDDIKNNIIEQVNLIGTFLLKEINSKCYNDAKNCFEVFGIDLMVDTNYNVKLIEVNTKIGYPTPDNDEMNFCEKLTSSIIQTVIDDFYPEFKNKKRNQQSIFSPHPTKDVIRV
jgi:hypothetical protein